MNKILVSLIVLGVVSAITPAFAKSSANASAEGAKVCTTKSTTRAAAPMKHKHTKRTIKKAK